MLTWLAVQMSENTTNCSNYLHWMPGLNLKQIQVFTEISTTTCPSQCKKNNALQLCEWLGAPYSYMLLRSQFLSERLLL
jgi:hypothetical protein